MDVEPIEDRPVPAQGVAAWLRNANYNPNLLALIRRARRALPGDPDFGDPLSIAGEGGVMAAARAADRLMRERDAATREVGLATLQVWQAIAEKLSSRRTQADVTLLFTDLVGFSSWSLKAGDEATLRLLRRVAMVAEPPVLDSGGHIVKRMGDGMMAVFADPAVAVNAALEALDAVKTVEVEGYTPNMRAGIHTGRPQRIGSDWLGVDVNIAARVMERATKGGLIISDATLQGIPPETLEELGVTAKRVRRQVFSPRQQGMPADLAMYRVKLRPGPPEAAADTEQAAADPERPDTESPE